MLGKIYQIHFLIHSLLLFLYLGHFYLPYSVFLSFDDFSTFNSSSGSLSTSMLSSRSLFFFLGEPKDIIFLVGAKDDLIIRVETRRSLIYRLNNGKAVPL